MSKKRPTEASWESDEDLLGDGSSVSAFSSKMQGDVTIEDIDEDALLMEEEEKSNNFSFQSQDEIIERVDLGISSENCAFDDTANSQELDYNDEGEEAPELQVYDEEIEDPLFVGEQPNDTTCIAQHSQPISYTQESHADDDDEEEEEEDDEGNTKKDRGRFQTERKTISLVSTHTKSSDIPDSLEITKEMQEEIDSFEKQKGRGKFHNKGQRGGLRTRGQRQMGNQQQQHQQHQQRFQAPINRGGPRQRGPNFGNRSPMFQGARNANPNNMRPRGPNNMMRPQGPQQGQFQQGQFQQGQFQQRFSSRQLGPSPGMNNGRPRFPHEMMQQRGPRSSQAGHGIQMPQPLLSSTPQNTQVYQESPQFIQPVGEQTQFHQPQHNQPQHSQPQPLIPLSQPSSGANIHVNPNFQGSLPPDIHSQHIPQSAPQPLFSQPQPVQNFQTGNQAWMGQTQHSMPAQVNYTSSPHPSHVQQQQHQMMATGQRPGILGSPPQGLMQQRPQHQGNAPPQPHNVNQGQPRQMFNNQQYQPRPQKPNIRPVTQRLGQQEPNVRPVTQRLGPQQSNVRPVTQRLGQVPGLNQGPKNSTQQPRQPRPFVNQNPRGPRPANQNRAQLTQMRPRGPSPGARNPQMGQPRFQAPQGLLSSGQGQGFNPKPVNLVSPVKKEQEIDPEKARKIQELEEKKRQRAERFKDNVPVNEGNLVNKKVIISRAQKRPSGDPPKESEEVSPAKTIKIGRLGSNVTVKEEIKTEAEEEMDADTALKKALEEQKRRRDLILKAKEAKRLLLASKRRQNLVVKLAQEGKTLADVKSPASGNESSGVNQNTPSQIQHFQGHQMQGKGQQYNQGQHMHMQGYEGQGYMHNQQQGVQQQQFNTNIPKRGMNRGHISNRGHMSNSGQNVNRGQGIRPQGQPISVLGQSQPTMSSHQVGRGRGNVKGRGVPKQSNIVQLQQVELHENIDYESYDSQFGTESSGNRTVLPLSTGSRQVVGMNSMGASSQVTPERKVMEKKEVFSPQRRIVLDSKQSSSVLIKDLPVKVDLGKISKRCAEYGKTKVFNYKAEEKSIVVQFSSPAEAAAFLNKSFRFMVDMNYCNAVAIPDNYV